ncbi:MAG: hypothetical protein CMLOHMNK_00082 [Steroidobacteraceae bacterium]|nr:hypothetical protein [Steroidobacteraceae bacterium]
MKRRSALLPTTARAVALAALASLYACTTATPTASVSGTAFYRERIALPPDAVFEAQLEDAARADAPARVIASTRIASPGSPPFAFTITYDPAQLAPGHRLVLRARVLRGAEVLFASGAGTPLPTDAAPVEILMMSATATRSTASPGTGSAATAPERPTLMRGQYTYLADAGVFTDCASGERVPVAQALDNAALEAAYGEARATPGAPMLATLVGRIAMHDAMEGPPRRTLLVEQFIRVSTATCAQPDAPALEDTYWRLVALDGVPIGLAADQRAPDIVLQSRDRRAAGFAGCNRLTGGYTVDGAKLAFTDMASTMMACPQGMDIEQSLHEALAKVAGWTLDGRRLDLRDGAGRSVAMFETGESGQRAAGG